MTQKLAEFAAAPGGQRLTLIPVIKLFADMVDLIRGLPPKPSDIADLLLFEGITGLRRHGQFCPITNYLKAHLDIPDKVKVWTSFGSVFIRFGDTEHRFVTPLPVAQFIVRFDAGEYPELIGSSDPKAAAVAA